MALKNLLHKKYIVPLLFFIAFLAIGLSLVEDYGISWDEEWQHTNAEVSAQYINEWYYPFSEEKVSKYELCEYWNRHHGVLFTLSTYFLEWKLEYNLKDDFRKIYKLRHDLVFLLFWLSLVVFYHIGRLRFKDWRWALAGSLCLILSPRIFGHAFFNPKDIVVLAFYVFSTFSLLGILYFKKWYWAILHGVFCAMLISSRIAGIIVPALTLLFILADLMNERFKFKFLWRYLLILILYLPIVYYLTIAFWPLMWVDPHIQFLDVFEAMSEYTWDGKVLFQGQFFPAGTIPWYYVPFWIAITTPVLYLVFGVLGILFIIWQTFKGLAKLRLFSSKENRTDLLLLALFLGPPLAVIYKEAVVYDGWRHLYFIYPSFLLMALIGFRQMHQWLLARKYNRIWNFSRQGVLGLAVISLLYTTWFMVRYHPHQNVYFSEFMQDHDQLAHYELDYWGTSYKQGFEALAKIDQRDVIRVAFGSYPAELNWQYLRPHIKPRFILVKNYEEADYFLSNYRHWEKGIALYQKREGIYAGEEVYHICVGNTKIFGIYRVKRSSELDSEEGFE